MSKRIVMLLALLTVTGLAARCGASPTSLLDTIGANPTPMFQVGSEVVKSIEVGFETHPASGLFTGLRPTFHTVAASDHNPYLNPAFEFGVCEKGTSGVPVGLNSQDTTAPACGRHSRSQPKQAATSMVYR